MKNLKSTILTTAMLIAGIATVKAQTGNDIIKKYEAAIGGDKWNSVTSLKVTSALSYSGMEMEMTETTLPNKAYRMDMSAAGMNGYTIVTPAEGWSFMPMMGQSAPEAMKADDLKGSQEKLNLRKNMHVNLLDDGDKAELAGKEKVGDVECFNVKVTDKDGGVSNLFFDAKTNYLVCMKAKVKAQGQEVEVTEKFSDYKAQDNGIVLAMKTEVEGQGSQVIKTVEVNKPIEDSVFKPAK